MRFHPTTLLGVVFSVLPLSFGSPVLDLDIIRRTEPPTQSFPQVIRFDLDIVSVASANTTIYNCDPSHAGCIQSRSGAQVIVQGEPICAPGTTFIESSCANSFVSQVRCRLPLGLIKTYYSKCTDAETCVYLSHSGDSRARCVPSNSLLRWTTDAGPNPTSNIVRSTNPGIVGTLINNYYNERGGIAVASKSEFFTNPGRIPAGVNSQNFAGQSYIGTRPVSGLASDSQLERSQCDFKCKSHLIVGSFVEG
jgi:hypothetical protein